MLTKIFAVTAVALFADIALADYRNDVDLISLHYDHAPDRDDAHAAVAGLMVTSQLRISPIVVSGAYGDGNRQRYNPAAEKVMSATWGNQWTNAHDDWNNSVASTASRWLSTLNQGGDIYVAEGGQSDFTSDVVRDIQGRSSVDTTNRITVVQHSGWNENQANPADLRFVKDNTNYLRIDNGNFSNDTANLNQRSASFVATARSSRFSEAWEAAFSYLNPNEKLDFSDTVALLHILGIDKTVVATVDDFAVRFFREPIDEINTSVPTPEPIEEDTELQQQAPQCSSAAADSDGDGYGWENNQSCVQASGSNSIAQPNQTVLPLETPVFPVCSAGISDTDSDGYGWENSQTCTIDQLTNVSLPSTNTEVISFIPVCSNNASDHDNDGYGWENSHSCQVSSDEETQTTSYPSIEDIICSTTVIDYDGDGFGWENNRSCTINRSNNTTTVSLVTFPACSPGTSDSDGDGYAWENESTCVISDTGETGIALVTLPSCSESSLDSDGDGYGWENNRSCAIAQSSVDQSNTSVTVVTFPTCDESVVDADFDGFGEANNGTCVMPHQSQTVTLFGVVFPVCNTQSIDENNDGYGWQNETTCIFLSTFPDPTLLHPLPACSSAIIDYDSDGYGWESDRSCIFR